MTASGEEALLDREAWMAGAGPRSGNVRVSVVNKPGQSLWQEKRLETLVEVGKIDQVGITEPNPCILSWFW
ncbi:unnamed protein product [Urochloa humidicola]